MSDTETKTAKTTANTNEKAVSKLANKQILQARGNFRTIKSFVNSVPANEIPPSLAWLINKIGFLIQNSYQMKNLNVNLMTPENREVYIALAKIQRKKEFLSSNITPEKLEQITKLTEIEGEFLALARKCDKILSS